MIVLCQRMLGFCSWWSRGRRRGDRDCLFFGSSPFRRRRRGRRLRKSLGLPRDLRDREGRFGIDTLLGIGVVWVQIFLGWAPEKKRLGQRAQNDGSGVRCWGTDSRVVRGDFEGDQHEVLWFQHVAIVLVGLENWADELEALLVAAVELQNLVVGVEIPVVAAV